MSSEQEVRDTLWLAIRNGLENQFINAEYIPAEALEDEHLDRLADGVRGKILEAHRVEPC